MRRVAHSRSRSLACREHHRRRLRKRNMGAPLHSHFSNDTLRFQEAHLFSRTGQAFFSFASFLSFFSFFFLERDCLLCAICDTWLRACSSILNHRRKEESHWIFSGYKDPRRKLLVQDCEHLSLKIICMPWMMMVCPQSW